MKTDLSLTLLCLSPLIGQLLGITSAITVETWIDIILMLLSTECECFDIEMLERLSGNWTNRDTDLRTNGDRTVEAISRH